MKKQLLLTCVLMTGMAFGQGVRYDSNVTTTASNVPAGASAAIMTVPNAIVTVCAYPASGSPCTNTVSLFSDMALTQPLPSNPLTTDAKGRFGFWVAPGVYTYTVQNQFRVVVGTYNISLNTIGISATPIASQTITQPAGTSLLVNTTNSYNSSTYHVNGGIVADGVNLTNLFQFTNLFQNGSASLVGAMQTGSSSTNVEVDGVLGVAVQNGGSSFAVGVRSSSVCQLPRSCWGANFLSTDVATTGAGSTLWGIESDTNVYNTSTIGQGIAITGYFDVQPAANMNALNIFVVPKTGTNNAWNAGIVFTPGDIAGNGPAIFLPPQLNTFSQNSQNITLQSEDSGGGINTAHFFLDPSGELDFCTFSLFTNCPRVNTTGDFVTPHQLIGQVATGTPPLIVNSTTPVANLITANQPIAFVNGSSTISTATKIFSTACTMASGTCTKSIPTGIFSNAPACTLTPVIGDAAGTTEPTFWFGSITNTSLVMRASSTAFSGNVVAVCFGQ